MSRASIAALLLTFAALGACGQRESPASVANVTLAGGIVAKVGETEIPASLVGQVAGARSIAPREALRLLLDDALAASAARARNAHAESIIAREITGVSARAAVAHVREEMRASPPTIAELEEFAEHRWREVDLPEQVHVIHAVVLKDAKIAGQAETGPALARELVAAVAAAHDATEFEQLARKVPHPGQNVRVEDLPTFVRDGRVSAAGPDSAMDVTFAAAAFELATPGSTSSIIETPFGWHVIRLIERLPGKHVPPAERSAYFAEDIYAARARRELNTTLTAARTRLRPDVSTAAETLMAEVVVGGE